MHGQNPVRKADLGSGQTLQVREVFYTLQGEGPHVGKPAVFVRLTGCNLRCWFCDTEWDDNTDRLWPVKALVSLIYELAPQHCSLVVLTGGEPMRQPLKPLLHLLSRWNRFTVQVETAGTLWQECVDRPNVELVVSPKTPRINPHVYRRAAAFKYVVRAGELGQDGLPVGSSQRQGEAAVLAKPRAGAPVYLSPCDEGDPERNQANLAAVREAALTHGFRAGVQLHKLLGVR